MSPRPDEPFESSDRPDRSDRSDRPDRPDRAARPDRSARPGRADGSVDRARPDRDVPSSSSAHDPSPGTGGDGGQDPGGEPRSAPVPPTRQPTPVTQQVGRVVIVLLAVLFGVFAVDNSQSVDFAWIFGESQVTSDGRGGVPLIVLLVGAALIGAALGALVEWQFLRARRAQRADREQRADRGRS